MSLLISEIDEVGRSLAHLLRPGDAVSRAKRGAIRAVLRKAVLAAQAADDAALSLEAARTTLAELYTLQAEYNPPPDQALAQRLDARRRFGAVDPALFEKGDFMASGARQADELSALLEARIERTLSVLNARDRGEDGTGRVGESRPIRHREELKELVTKRTS